MNSDQEKFLQESCAAVIAGKMFPWEDKAPYTYRPSSYGPHGVKAVHKESGKLVCNECGGLFDKLANHVLQAHQIRAREYKQEQGISLSEPLYSLRLQEVHRKKAIAHNFGLHRSSIKSSPTIKEKAQPGGPTATCTVVENPTWSLFESSSLGRVLTLPTVNGTRFGFRNNHGSCMEQTIVKAKLLVESLGRLPTKGERSRARLHDKTVFPLFGVKDWKSFWTIIGLADLPEKGRHQIYTKPLLEEILRDFYVKELRLPTDKEFGRLLPARQTFNYYYGSLDNALAAAGLSNVLKNMKRICTNCGHEWKARASSAHKPTKCTNPECGKAQLKKEW